jgi:hypothetical protein
LVSKLAKTTKLRKYKTCFCKNSKREFYADFELYEKVGNNMETIFINFWPGGSILSLR